jgi:ribulose bisphosphate carboxylase small subunit
VWAYVLLNHTPTNPNPPKTLPQPPPESIQHTILTYKDVFQDPKALPPHRIHDHAIPLIPGAIPINSRPYHYSPHHKTEIEKQVQELLDKGFIVHSSSPFASPVLLVKKKDGTWRMCVDYRKLNELTIKNRFPMPVVEEILDELAGS